MNERTAWLVVEDGTAYPARAVGAEGETFGEIVFNTAMTGYQEVVTDPSYKGQIVCMTYPHIGNYGVNDEDAESCRPWLEGFVVRELSPIASNFRSEGTLEDYLKRHKIIAVDGVDTRALTVKLRQQGSMRAGLSTTEHDPHKLLDRVRAAPDIIGIDLVKQVTCEQAYEWPIEGDAAATGGSRSTAALPRRRVTVMDFGVKYNILRQLSSLGCQVTVVPATASSNDVMATNPDGIVLSNGPGDPAAVTYAITTIRDLLGKAPILGICLGHQLLGLAYGGQTFKLKFGHHGGNHPVQDASTGKVEITSQNHNFAVDLDSIPQRRVELTHKNLNDGTVEGMKHKDLPVFSLQYHPEAAPGPHDARYLFQRFLHTINV